MNEVIFFFFITSVKKSFNLQYSSICHYLLKFMFISLFIEFAFLFLFLFRRSLFLIKPGNKNKSSFSKLFYLNKRQSIKYIQQQANNKVIYH